MEDWKRFTLLLCFYGFFKELRPSESFVTPYLRSAEFKNLTASEVNNQIYPISTYSTLVWLAVVLVTSDVCRQRPTLLSGSLASVVTWAILIWADGVVAMQMMQFTFGLVVASEIAYYSYVYLTVNLENYQKATSITRIAVLIARCSSGVLAQLFVSLHLLDYLELNYLSLAFVSIAFVLSLLLPAPRRKVFQTEPEPEVESALAPMYIEEAAEEVNVVKSFTRATVEQLKEIVIAVKESYSRSSTLKWSLWWAFASCGYFEVGNYGQNIWDEISPSRENPEIYNGAVRAVSTMIAALLTYLVGFIPIDWKKFGELLLCVVCLLDGVCLIVLSQTDNLYIAYGMYLLFRAVYHPGITAAYFQIAASLRRERYGLIFGINTFIAILLETIVTVIVVDSSGLHLPIRVQFLIYGIYFGVLALVFMIASGWTLYTMYKKQRSPPS